MAATLIFTQPRPQGLLAKLKNQKTLGERLRSAKPRGVWGPRLDHCGLGDGFSFFCLFVCLGISF